MADLATYARLTDEQSDIGVLYDLVWRRPAWHADAACAEHPELTWFPAIGESTQPALQVCAGCLVQQECRAWALDQPPTLQGVWGGTSQQQRSAVTRPHLRRQRPDLA